MMKKMPITLHSPLLSHPWYRAWECGALPKEALRTYAREYYWQVACFPRYLGRLHSQLENPKHRQVILGNLIDEEDPRAPHPELWLDFAEALGLDRESVRSGKPGTDVAQLTQTFHRLMDSGPEEGLGAVLAYESQVPEVAKFKSKALREYYLESDAAEKGTRFFAVHESADVWHTEALVAVIEGLSPEQKDKAQIAADQASQALWKFLDAMPTTAVN